MKIVEVGRWLSGQSGSLGDTVGSDGDLVGTARVLTSV
jgi:hypothetical protein